MPSSNEGTCIMRVSEVDSVLDREGMWGLLLPPLLEAMYRITILKTQVST